MRVRLSQVIYVLPNIKSSLISLWNTRDELNIRNIRIEYLHYFLPMVLVLTLLDQRLTPTEKMIFNYCIEGKSNKEIISLMYISISTLRTHNSHIYEKLNVVSRDGLLLYVELIKKSGRLKYIQ